MVDAISLGHRYIILIRRLSDCNICFPLCVSRALLAQRAVVSLVDKGMSLLLNCRQFAMLFTTGAILFLVSASTYKHPRTANRLSNEHHRPCQVRREVKTLLHA